MEYLLCLVCIGNVSCARSDAHLMSTTLNSTVNISSMCKLQNTTVFPGPTRYRNRFHLLELYCVVNSLDADTDIDAFPRHVIYSLKYHCISNLPGRLWYGLGAGANLRSIELQNCRLTHIASNALTEITTLRRLVIQFEPLNGKGKDSCSHENGPKNVGMSNTTNMVCLENYLWFSKGIFSGNKLLIILTMDGVMLNNSIWAEIRELRNLQHLSFCGNNITVLPTGSLNKLTELTTLSISKNRINAIFKRTFASQNNLEILNLSLNRIKTIEKHAFDGLMSLQVLNIARNQITVLHGGLFEPFRYLQQLDLSNNHIETTELGLFSRLNMLKELNLSKNNIHEISDDIFIRDGNLKLLDISYNNISAFHFTNGNAYYYRNYLSSTLETLFMQGNNIVTVNWSTLLMFPSLKTLDMSNNTLHYITFDISELPKKLEALNVTRNRMNGLRKLNLAKNKLTVLEPGMFEGLPRLETMDLSLNQIREIEHGSIESLTSLNYLDIRGNQLQTISATNFEYFARIQSLSLSQNPWSCECSFLILMIRFLNRNIERIDDFDAITCKYFNKEKNMHLEHFLHDAHTAQFCDSEEVVYKILDKPLVISISVILSVIIICVVAFIVAFRNRKFLRLWCFMKFHFRFGCRKEIGDDNRPYDAFLSYCSSDGRVIVHEIVPRLEEPRNGKQGYKLYVSDRDFPAGGSIAETIIHALNITKRVIVIVSDNYLQSEWCQYEFRQAHYQLIKEKSNRIIMIVLEELNPDLIYEEIGHYLKTRTYVKYDDPLLWPKVEYAMPDTLAIINNRNQNQDDDRAEFIPLEVMSGNI